MSKFPGLRLAVLAGCALAAAGARGSSYTRSMEFTDGTPGAEFIRAVAADNAGNLLLAGRDMGAPTKHWIAKVSAAGVLQWVRHSGDGFPDVISQGYVESYGAAFISGHMVVVGETRTATGASQNMGFIANLDPTNGTVLGVTYFPGTIGYNCAFRAVAGDPSDSTLAWVAGWTDSAVTGLDGLLVKYNVNVGTPAQIDYRTLDLLSASGDDYWYSIAVTPGAIHLGGAHSLASSFPCWARYDKTMTFQQQAVHTVPAGQTEGAYAAVTMAAGRLYAAVVGGTSGPIAYDSLDVRELNPASGSMLGTFITLESNGPTLGIDTMFSCGMAVSPATGRILVADFDRAWDLTPDLGLYSTLLVPNNWHTDALAFFPDGRFATAGWDQVGNPGTAAVWTPASTSGGSSSTISMDTGTLKIAPNVLELSTGGWTGFHVLGDPASPFEITIYDMAGRTVGTLGGTTDAAGNGLIKFYGGNRGRDSGWSEDPLAPGPYRAVATGAGLDKKPKPFVIILKRKS